MDLLEQGPAAMAAIPADGGEQSLPLFEKLERAFAARVAKEDGLATLKPVDLGEDQSEDLLDLGDCGAGGICPVW
jgi:hypothetical protein